jgi:hypothetical protein
VRNKTWWMPQVLQGGLQHEAARPTRPNDQLSSAQFVLSRVAR